MPRPRPGRAFPVTGPTSSTAQVRSDRVLGHSRIDVTMNVYAHVLPHIQEQAMGRFERRFQGPGGSPLASSSEPSQ